MKILWSLLKLCQTYSELCFLCQILYSQFLNTIIYGEEKTLAWEISRGLWVELEEFGEGGQQGYDSMESFSLTRTDLCSQEMNYIFRKIQGHTWRLVVLCIYQGSQSHVGDGSFTLAGSCLS